MTKRNILILCQIEELFSWDGKERQKKYIISDGRVCCDWIRQKNRKVVMFDRKKHDI